MRWLIRTVDTVSQSVGEALQWVAIAIVCLGGSEVVMRYVFNRPTQWGYETLLMLGAGMYVLSWADIQRQNAHIRVDVIYNLLSARAKRVVDVLCTVVLFLPLMSILVYMAWARMWRSWAIAEKSIETTWYPPLGPLRTAVFLGFLLFTLQGIVQLIQNLHALLRDDRHD
jgi:TRAP-type mannitol/chloroaromatic compound transport system permease small subunit